MYNYISGKLVHKEPMMAVVETGGIGYEIKIPLSVFSQLKEGEECKLYTYFQVKEDAHQLFGFTEKADKELFILLLSVSGIGPGIALTILSSMSAVEVREAIISGNVRKIQSVKGIGLKTAERAILELKDKMQKIPSAVPEGVSVNLDFQVVRMRDEALSALVALGINKAMAEKNIEAVFQKFGKTLSIEELIKQALKQN